MKREALWDIANQLRDVLPLDTLSEREGEELISHMRVRRFSDGEVVYHRGDPGDDAFVVHSGFVKAVLLDEQGHELLIGRYGRGEFFGTLALVKPRPRESTVAALVRSTVLQVGRADVMRVLERNPRALAFMIERMSDTIARLADQYEARNFLDVRGRLARYLIELRGFDEVPVRQEDIAAAIGATRFIVNRILGEFERRGLVVVGRQRVRVLDPKGLRREIRS